MISAAKAIAEVTAIISKTTTKNTYNGGMILQNLSCRGMLMALATFTIVSVEVKNAA